LELKAERFEFYQTTKPLLLNRHWFSIRGWWRSGKSIWNPKKTEWIAHYCSIFEQETTFFSTETL